MSSRTVIFTLATLWPVSLAAQQGRVSDSMSTRPTGQHVSSFDEGLANTPRVSRLEIIPDTIRLRVGEVLPTARLQITAYDSSGAVVLPFLTAYRLYGSTVADMRRPGIVALTPGSTILGIGASARGPTGGIYMREIRQVPLIVVEVQSRDSS